MQIIFKEYKLSLKYHCLVMNDYSQNKANHFFLTLKRTMRAYNRKNATTYLHNHLVNKCEFLEKNATAWRSIHKL